MINTAVNIYAYVVTIAKRRLYRFDRRHRDVTIVFSKVQQHGHFDVPCPVQHGVNTTP